MNSKGGTEKYLIRTVEYLRKEHEIKIYTMKYDPKVWPEVKKLVIDLGEPWFLKRIKNRKASATLIALAMKLQSRKIPNNYDLYNTHIFPANFVHKKPQVWTCQEPARMLYDLYNETLKELNSIEKIIAKIYFPLLKIWDKIETKRNVDHLIANSNYMKEYLERIYKKPTTKIYPGVEKEYFKIKKKKTNTILAIGRLYRAKRINLTIKAFSLALKKHKEINLEIIGKGPEEESLKKLVKELKIQDKIKFLNEVNDKILKEAYAKAKIILYTPIREPFGIIPIESMASGTPIIAINEGGPKETIVNGKTGFLVKADEKEIAEKINLLMRNTRLYTKMSKAGRERAKEFTWEKTAKTISEFLHKYPCKTKHQS